MIAASIIVDPLVSRIRLSTQAAGAPAVPRGADYEARGAETNPSAAGRETSDRAGRPASAGQALSDHAPVAYARSTPDRRGVRRRRAVAQIHRTDRFRIGRKCRPPLPIRYPRTWRSIAARAAERAQRRARIAHRCTALPPGSAATEFAAAHDRFVIRRRRNGEKWPQSIARPAAQFTHHAPAMDPALASAAAPARSTFEDGLGERHRVVDRARNEPVEMLCLRGELTAVPSFEFALRERVSHLAAVPPRLLRARAQRRAAEGSGVDAGAGVRRHRRHAAVGDPARSRKRADVTLDIDAALCLLRQLVPAVAMLHENMPDIAHGAIAAERLIVTPGARLIVVEHVLGSALEQLRFSQERYWQRAARRGAAIRPGCRGSIIAPTSRSSASSRCR